MSHCRPPPSNAGTSNHKPATSHRRPPPGPAWFPGPRPAVPRCQFLSQAPTAAAWSSSAPGLCPAIPGRRFLDLPSAAGSGSVPWPALAVLRHRFLRQAPPAPSTNACCEYWYVSYLDEEILLCFFFFTGILVHIFNA
jgi:hypothetical protein